MRYWVRKADDGRRYQLAELSEDEPGIEAAVFAEAATIEGLVGQIKTLYDDGRLCGGVYTGVSSEHVPTALNTKEHREFWASFNSYFGIPQTK